MHNKKYNWEVTDKSFFLEMLNISNDNFVEVGIDDLHELGKKYGDGAYHDILGKYDKVIVSKQTEGYGMSNKLQHFYENFDSNKIFVINDGFICEKNFDKIYPTVPRENIFYDPILSFWYSWNHVLSDNSRILANSHNKGNPLHNRSSKINDGFRNIHNNNIDTLCDYESKMDRDFKFIVLNNNYKPGRAQFIDILSESFIKENWVSANFFKEYFWNLHHWKTFYPLVTNPAEKEEYKYLREDDYSKYENDQSGWNSCYEILWKEHLNKAYIQPYWESCAWTDAVTDGHYMVTEKTLLPLLMGQLTIPLGIFYVDYLEKMGYQFVKKIGDVGINESISQDMVSYKLQKELYDKEKDQLFCTKWNFELFNKINKINDLYSLKDIKDIYIENYDIVKHNKELLKHHASDNSILDKLKKWILQ